MHLSTHLEGPGAHVLCVMKGTTVVWRLPHIDIRRKVQYASEIDTTCNTSMNWVENVFWRGIKAFALILLPGLYGNLKMVFGIEEPEESEGQAASIVPSHRISMEVLNSIPTPSGIS